MNHQVKIDLYPDRMALGRSLWSAVLEIADVRVKANQRFSVAMSGGSIPEILSSALDAVRVTESVDLSAWQVFWVDERWVPQSDPESNFSTAQSCFFSRLPIRADQIHAMDTSLSPRQCAQAYESKLLDLLQPEPGQMPRFDLMLLGVGPDGHTASLFPEYPELQEAHHWVVPVFNAPKPPPTRITLTLPLINNARHLFFIAAGSGKAEIVARLLNPTSQRPDLPAQQVMPSCGSLRWLLDHGAATRLRLQNKRSGK